jgi:Holliday junction DNA helicase RuvA
MYDYIQGDMAAKSPVHAVIEANGVGYRITIPLSTYEVLPDSGAVRLLTYLHVREDVLRLFGFATEKERALFTRLLSVSGIGPGMAISVLNGLPVDEFRQAVADEDTATLRRIKGVGQKTAERIVVELKREMERELVQERAEGRVASVAGMTSDAVAAMLALGYTRSAAEAAVGRALKKLGRDAALEQVVRTALQEA